MKMEQWDAIQDIFNNALELPANQRQQYIKTQCQHDHALIAEVNQLLLASQESDSFLDELSGQLYPLLNNQYSQNDQVGHYQLQEKIGEGGMGVVYRAFDTRLQRTVAIKFMAISQMDSDRSRERFLHEAKAAAQLQHRNLCDVFEVGETDAGHLYIVTTFCEGRNLNELIGLNQLNIGDILRLFIQLSDALSAVHKKGIFHRDLKPSNIIVDKDMSLKLVDFGIAKISGVELSRTGELLGSVAYIAPEQFSNGSVDHRSDIWSLGILFYEALKGERPYPGDSASKIMYQVFHNDIPQICDDDLPMLKTFNQIISRCLQLDPQVRYQDVLLLLHDLKNLYQQLQQEQLLDFTPIVAKSREPVFESRSMLVEELRKMTALGITMPDDEHALNITIQRQIKRHSGHVVACQQRHCVYACFGYPELGEGAADNALQCAMAVLNRIGNQDNVQIKMVVDTVSMLIRQEDENQPPEYTGNLPTILDELLTLNPSNVILLTESVNKRLRQSYTVQALDGIKTRSYQQVFELKAVAGLTPGHRYSSPLTGRFHELGLLKNHWRHMLDGESKAILVSGEAGLGKTRILHELKQSCLDSTDCHILELGCDPNQGDSPFYPVIQGIRQWLLYFFDAQSSEMDNTSESIFTKILPTWLKRLQLDIDKNLPYLSWILGLDADNAYPEWQQHSPEALKRMGLESLQQCLASEAQQKPLLWIIEDLHWADISTLEWIERILTMPLPNGILLVFTGRNEMFQRWRTHSEISHLALSKFTKTETLQLVRHILHSDQVDQHLELQIIDKTSGNPLFVEEYAQMLLQQADQESSQGASLQVPDSLQEMLLVRLDRMGNAKRTAQVGAIIGRVFDPEMLLALLDIPALSLDNQLKQLQKANIVYLHDHQAQQFIFKHALIQDALYLSLPEQQRQQLHLQLAKQLHALRKDKTESTDQEIKPELVAHHYSAAKQSALATPLWLEAARQALRTHATQETVALCHHGIQELQYLPEGSERIEWEISLQMTLGPAIMATKGYSDHGSAEAYQRALDLCADSDNPELLLPVLFGLWTYLLVRSKYKQGIPLINRMMDIAESLDNDDYRVEAYLAHGLNTYYLGMRKQARSSLNTCVSCYRPGMSKSHPPVYGQDPSVVALSYLSWMAQEEGDHPQALQHSNEALQRAFDSHHPLTLCYGQVYAVSVNLMAGNIARAEQLVADNLALCEKQGVIELYKLTDVFTGLISIAKGELEAGLQQFRDAVEVHNTTGAEIFVPLWMIFEAQTLVQLGRIDEAARVLQQAREKAEADSALVYLPRIEQVYQQLNPSLDQ